METTPIPLKFSTIFKKFTFFKNLGVSFTANANNIFSASDVVCVDSDCNDDNCFSNHSNGSSG